MARRKKEPESTERRVNPNVVGLKAELLEQPITDTLEVNFMPYALSVIVSRAIPEIDGFKPAHRKLLYCMYKMGLLTGGRTKSANIVGATMRYNPHGDAAIYDTMVRLSRGNESLLLPFVDSKGNFGKVYSRDMAYAAPRYTEAKLAPVCAELFRDIDKDAIDMVPNYDGTLTEPTLLPTTFPNVLVSPNLGIAVGMASNICSFNLEEVCRATIEYMRNPEVDLMSIMQAPDFSTGGEVIYDPDAIREVYETGRGSIKLRARWRYVREGNLIEIYEIPYTTTAEQIMDKVAELVKAGKLREISDMRDETDLSGLKLTIDLKRGTDPDALMAKLMKTTTLMDTFACNFNVLIAGTPRVLGVRELLEEWTAWRIECIKRRTYSEITQKKDRLHLLQGLGKILLDIDKAIRIIRDTEEESAVVPNLMIGFGIDEAQAEFVADIRLRNINREYILRRTKDTEDLEKEIADLEDLLSKRNRIKAVIKDELEQVIKKHGQPRRTGIVYSDEMPAPAEEEPAADYPVTVFMSRGGYLKKITALSLRMSGEQKYKEGDSPFVQYESTNNSELLVFTDRFQCYKTRLSEFEDGKASNLGDYVPTKLGMDDGENVVFAMDPGDYKGSVMFFFENGKAARVELEAYATKTNRRRLTAAYSDKSPLVAVLPVKEDAEMAVTADDSRTLVFHSALVSPKTTRATQGVQVISLKKGRRLVSAAMLADTQIKNVSRYRGKNLPAAGALLKAEDTGAEQLTLE